MSDERLSISRLRELLDYDPTTGLFVWKVAQPRTPVGAQAGHLGPGGRLVVKLDGHLHYLSRLAWAYVHGVWPQGKIINRNDNKSDVRFSNLIERTPSEVVSSSKTNSLNTSGEKGVSWVKTKAKWRAGITRDGVQYFLGFFDTKEEATAAYRRAVAGDLPAKGSRKDPNWATSRRQRSAPWKAIQENPKIVGWDSLGQFVADLGEPPTAEHVLMRQRYDELLGPGNAMWRLPWSRRAGHEAEPQKSYNLMQFDISVDEYNQLLAEQEGLCAICRRPESIPFKGVTRRLAVDHDHRTGAVRGLLCGQCNNGLGRFDDDPLRLRAAAEYLEAWAEKQTNVVPLVKKDAF